MGREWNSWGNCITHQAANPQTGVGFPDNHVGFFPAGLQAERLGADESQDDRYHEEGCELFRNIKQLCEQQNKPKLTLSLSYMYGSLLFHSSYPRIARSF